MRSQSPISSHQNGYHSSHTPPPKVSPQRSPAQIVPNQFPFVPADSLHRMPITPTEARFFPIPVVRSISPVVVRAENHSRSNSPLVGYQSVTTVKVGANGINGMNPQMNGSHQKMMQAMTVRQRVFNVSNGGRENRHKTDMNLERMDQMNELVRVKERNVSLTKKLQILEEIIGNSGLEIMEQKINKLLFENDRLTSILQENKAASNLPSPSKGQNEYIQEIERLNKIIQAQANDVEIWRKRWNEAEKTSLNMSKSLFQHKDSGESERFNKLLQEKTDEIENINAQLKNQIESASLQELEQTKKITILLQENDKLNSILNVQINELDKLANKYQELESKQSGNSIYEAKFEAIQREMAQNNNKMNQLLQENEYLMQKIKEQDKDLSSIKALEQKIEIVVEENLKNHGMLKNKIEECEFLQKRFEDNRLNSEFLVKENNSQRFLIDELTAKINILVEENKKLNESVTIKIGENIALAALEEKIEILLEENRKLNELNSNQFQRNSSPPPTYYSDEVLIYREKAEFLEKKNLTLMEEIDRIRSEIQKNMVEKQQIGEIEEKIELLIEENSNLNNLLAQKDEEIFYLKKREGQGFMQSE